MTAGARAHKVRRLGHLDLPGGGQVVVDDGYPYVGHMHPPQGTGIIDVSDLRRPRLACQIALEDPWSHSHKVRVAGDLMITNVEQHRRHLLRKGTRLAATEGELGQRLGNPPEPAELAAALGLSVAQLADIRAGLERGYHAGGFKVWDVADRSRPRLLCYQRTHGCGAHRFDMDARYAYVSTEMEGFHGSILVIYDLASSDAPAEVSRWWLPGQHVAGGESPSWSGYDHRLHHALRCGDELWAAVWHAGFRVIDIADIGSPRTVGGYDYHPWVVEPTHTALPATRPIGGRRIALVCDEEHQHRHGQPHAGLWIFDVTRPERAQPLACFHLSEPDLPWSRAPGRFGMHQFAEHVEDTLVYCAWFSAGLRIVDIADPSAPREAGYYIPEPAPGQASPQSDEVDVDERGLIFLIDRYAGLDVLEFHP